MKVWIVSTGEPLPIDGENVRLRRMGSLAEYLVKRGNEVVWFSSSFEHYKKHQRCEKNQSIFLEEKYDIELLHTGGYKKNISISRILNQISFAEKVKRKMRELTKPDVIIATMAPLQASRIVAKFGIKEKVPVVIDIRDLWPEIYYDVISPKLYFLLNIYVKHCRKILESTFQESYGIIGTSQEFLNYGLKYAKRKQSDRDAVIPIGYPRYDYENYRDKFLEYWRKYNIDKSDFLVIYIGYFGDQVEFTPVIEASNILLKKYPNIKFILCGTGKYLDELKKRAGENVIFPGWIEKEQIITLLSNSNIGLIPYIDSIGFRTTTSNKFGEYLSASLPILVSVHGNMENYLEENKCGSYYKDGYDLASKIEKFFLDKEKFEQYSQNAKKLYNISFFGEKLNEKLYNFLIKIIKLYN